MAAMPCQRLVNSLTMTLVYMKKNREKGGGKDVAVD